MSGVRLVHDSKRGGIYVVLHPTRTYKEPFLCPTCSATHQKKAIHLKLDGEGAVIVSEQVFERLRECGLPHLEVSNEVHKPPNQIVGIGAQPGRFDILEHEVTGGKLLVLKNKLRTQRKRKYTDG